MDDLEQSYRVLELKPGATFKQCSEAREDMLALWNPDRFAQYPRLRSKANRKIQEINQAYEAVMRHVEQAEGRPQGSPARPRPQPSAAAEGAGAEGAGSGEKGSSGASLFDEVFAGGESKQRAPRVSGWLVAGLILATMLGFFLLRSSDSEPDAPRDTTSPQMEQASIPEAPPADLPSTPETSAKSPPAEKPPPVTEPPPPPKPLPNATGTTPQVRTAPPPLARRARATPSQPRPSQNQPGPVLLRESESAAPDEAEAAQARRISEENETAYQQLLAASEVARTLSQGGFETVRFLEWRTVQRTDSETWIDLVAQGSDGREEHFIWSVEAQTGQTRPLNTHARELERSGRPR